MNIISHLRIFGMVQGVGYRHAMQAEARRLGLAGWVRNRRDGSVEALASGDEAAVRALTEWAGRGPPRARVERVAVGTPPEGLPAAPRDFGTLPTP
jgi:acylphosphatase